MGQNLASKYADKVDERFTRKSQVEMALNKDYDFTGEKTVKVYSIPISPLNDYTRSGSTRYGTPSDITRNVQEMTVTQDKAFTFIIDKGDKIQSQMVSDAGKSLARELDEVVEPYFETYCFKALASAATAHGNYDTTAATKNNAYELFLKANEHMGNANVPDQGRVAFCSYRFANLLKQDSAFMKYSDSSQQMLIKGVIGEVDGTKIVKVPASRLPAGCAFIMTHAVAATAPRQLSEYRIHQDPPGISGWLVEGRFIFDCFILNEKSDAIYYLGSQPVLKNITVGTAATAASKSTILVTAAMEGAKRYYVTASSAAGLTAVTYGTAITTSAWTELTSGSVEITPTAGHTYVRVVEVDGSNKPIAVGDAVLNIG